MNDQITMPKVAQEGEACPNCAAPMAPDQRYCLNCGARRGEPRVPFNDYVGSNGGDAALAEALARASERSNEVSPLGVILGIALLGGMLLLGVLLGRDSGDETTTSTVAEAVSTAIPGTETATTPAETGGDVVSEWPAGTDGFTIELGTLPKDGTTASDIETTKSELEGRGVSTPVGVLDSDLYPSLPPSTYVVYSGVYTKKSEANSALSAVTASIPEAVVVEVSESASGGGGKSESSSSEAPDLGTAIPPATESEPASPATGTDEGAALPGLPSATGGAEDPTTATGEAAEQRSQAATGSGAEEDSNR